VKYFLSAHGVLAVLAVILVIGLIVFGITGTAVTAFYQSICYAVLGAFVSVNGAKAASQLTTTKATTITGS
jgi:hypothetical protein